MRTADIASLQTDSASTRDEPTTKTVDTDRHAARAEKQIRLGWREDIVHHEDDEHFDCGIWVAATPAARRQAEIICEVQNAVYGPGSHWVEERGQDDSPSANWPFDPGACR